LLIAFGVINLFNIILKTKGFKITKAVNVSIALGTGVFWGYFFDIVIFDKDIDIINLIGAFLVIFGSIINIK